jgi:hypothetical protein
LGLAGEEPFPVATLEALRQLIGCDGVGYNDIHRARRVVLA